MTVHYETDGDICVVTIDRPQARNAVDGVTAQALYEAFLRSPEGPEITALFAHNDDMALGAIQAMHESGVKPGSQVIVVSIDGINDAFQAILDGTANCTVECNPLIGPILFDTAEKIVRGETVPKRIQTPEMVYDKANVTPQVLAQRKY